MRLHFSLLPDSRRDLVVAAVLFCVGAGTSVAITAAATNAENTHSLVTHAGDAVAAIADFFDESPSPCAGAMARHPFASAVAAPSSTASGPLTARTGAMPQHPFPELAAGLSKTMSGSLSYHAGTMPRPSFPELAEGLSKTVFGSLSYRTGTIPKSAAGPATTAPESLGSAASARTSSVSTIDACNNFASWHADTTIGSPRWKTSATTGATISDAGTEVFDAVLTSPRFSVPTNGLQLRWHQHTQLSWANTAGVLEIAIAGGDWTDFRQASGRFLDGGYDSHAFAGNPLGARPAWGGEDQQFETRAELPATLGTRSVRLRFRLGSSGTGDARPGWQLSQLSCVGARLES